MKKTYQGVVIARFLQGKELKDFNQMYEDAKLQSQITRITDKDLKIVEDWKKGMTVRELSQKYKMTQSKIDSRIRAVAKMKLRNN